MRLSLTDDGFWRLDLIREEELEMLSGLCTAACPTDTAGIDRLFPDPIRPGLTGYQELLDDWDQLVRPEISDLIESAINTVATDLERIRAVPHDEIPPDDEEPDADDDASPGDDGPLFRLDVPLAHVEEWAKILNAARLSFAASHDLLDEDTLSPATIIKLVENGGQDAIDGYLRSELYGFLLAFLVEEAMSP